MASEKRKIIETGVQGFDMMIDGGIKENSSIVISGGPGSGKTIFALEFAVHGALKNENSLYVSFEQNEDDLIRQASLLTKSPETLLKQKKLFFLHIDPAKMDKNIIDEIRTIIEKNKIKRLVIDSLSFLLLNPVFFKEGKFTLINNGDVKVAGNIQQFIYLFITSLNKAKTTTLYISSINENNTQTKDSVSEYVCDGYITLSRNRIGKSVIRTIEVIKMRDTKTLGGIYPFSIDENGIRVETT